MNIFGNPAPGLFAFWGEFAGSDGFPGHSAGSGSRKKAGVADP
jgi:hypothetical protein